MPGHQKKSFLQKSFCFSVSFYDAVSLYEGGGREGGPFAGDYWRQVSKIAQPAHYPNLLQFGLHPL